MRRAGGLRRRAGRVRVRALGGPDPARGRRARAGRGARVDDRTGRRAARRRVVDRVAGAGRRLAGRAGRPRRHRGRDHPRRRGQGVRGCRAGRAGGGVLASRRRPARDHRASRPRRALDGHASECGGRGVTAAAIALGAGADLVFGDPRRGHPVAAFGHAAAALERVAHRPTRRAGAAYAGLLVGAVVVVAALLERRLPRTPIRAVALWTALGARSLMREAGAVADLVEAGDLGGARRRITALVGRDPEALDAAGLCAAAIESVAENTVDAVVAPLLWTAAAGAPGALGHRAVNTLDAMVGHRSPRYARFGTAAARADDLANWPAARLTAALAVLLGDDRGGALRAWREDAPAHPSPNAGRAEAAFAGALGIRLGGPLAYAGWVEQRPRLGDGREPGPADVRRAVRLAWKVSAASVALAAVIAGGRW